MSIYFQWCSEEEGARLRCDFCKKEMPDGEDFWILQRIIGCLEDGHEEIEGDADLEVMCFECENVINARIKAVTRMLKRKQQKKAKRKLTIPREGEQ